MSQTHLIIAGLIAGVIIGYALSDTLATYPGYSQAYDLFAPATA